MTAIIIAGLTATVIITVLVDRWARPQSADTGDDTRTIDILKRGEVCPWPRDC